MDSRRAKSVAVLSNDDYQSSLEHIIQRDYYPTADEASPATTVAGRRRQQESIFNEDDRRLTMMGPPKSSNLTSFHAGTTSCATATFDEKQNREAVNRQKHRASKYVAATTNPSSEQGHSYDSCDDDNDTQPADTKRQRTELSLPAPDAELRNALFFPHSVTDQARQTQKVAYSPQGHGPLRLDGNTSNEYSTSTTGTSFGQAVELAALQERSIQPSATRFPRPVGPLQGTSRHNDQHWEDSDDDTSTATDSHTCGDDASTDLDSTVVASIRSEIRRGVARKRRLRAEEQQQQHTRRIHNPLDMAMPPPKPFIAVTPSDVSQPRYQFPPMSPRSRGSSSSSSTSSTLLDQRKDSTSMTAPRRPNTVTGTKRSASERKDKAKSLLATKIPSARSSGAFAFSLRAAYSKQPPQPDRKTSSTQRRSASKLPK